MIAYFTSQPAQAQALSAFNKTGQGAVLEAMRNNNQLIFNEV